MVDESAKFGNSFGSQLGGEQKSVKELIDSCLKMTGINPQDKLWRERAIEMLDATQRTALKGRHWKFSHDEAYMNFFAPYDLGTVALVNNSYEVEESVDAGNGAVPVINFNVATMRGQVFHPRQGESRYYRIADTGNTVKKLTLTSRFSENSIGFATYEVLFDRYKLDPKISQIKSIVIPGYNEIVLMGQQEFREMQNRHPSVRRDTPKYATYGKFDEQSGAMILEVFPAPDKAYPFHIDYVVRPIGMQDSDSCYPVIPGDHQDVLQYGTMAKIYSHQNNEAQRRAQQSEYVAAWTKMASDQEMTDSRARVTQAKNYFDMPLQGAARRGRGRRRKFDYS